MSIATQIERIQSEVGIQTDKIAMIQDAMISQKALEASIIDKTIAGRYSNDTVTLIGEDAFLHCQGLTSVDLLAATTIDITAFYDCNGLTEVNLPSVTIISNLAFANCDNLISITIGNESQVCDLLHTNAFDDTPIASGTGYIYVPDSLVESYKTATNWSTYANQIIAIGE